MEEMRQEPAGLPEAVFRRMAEQAGGDPARLAAVSRAATLSGRFEIAYELAWQARFSAPNDADVRRHTAPAVAAGVPDWHFGIVRDEARNQAYDAAIRKAVTPGAFVLDIGAGTGLLALMAARAGAAAVVTCEVNRGVAAAAERVIEANGYAGLVRVVPKASTALDVGNDLERPADLLVSEIVSNDLLAEQVLSTMEDARRLLAPGARMIPAAGFIQIALAHWAALDEHRMGQAAGFDLSAFNLLAPHRYRVKIGDENLVLHSEPASAFAFDFASVGSYPPERRAVELIADGSPINGVAQWIRLQLDEEIFYENRPGRGRSSCWACLFYPFHATLHPGKGAAVRVRAGHDRRYLSFESES